MNLGGTKKLTLDRKEAKEAIHDGPDGQKNLIEDSEQTKNSA